MTIELEIFDREGTKRDWPWLVANYGPLEHKQAAAGPAYRLAALIERADPPGEAPASLIVKVLGGAGKPADGVSVAWYWPDAPEDANAGPIGGVLPQMRPNRCVYGPTNANGDVGFGMGHGAYYWPDKGQIGPHAAWMYGADTPSDIILGLGMIGGTNHSHLDTLWMWDDDQPEPPIDPPPPDDPRIGQALEWLFSSSERLARAADDQAKAMEILVELAGG